MTYLTCIESNTYNFQRCFYIYIYRSQRNQHDFQFDMHVSNHRYLAPDPEVVIGDKLRGGMGALISHAKGVDVPKDDDGDGSKEEALLPSLISTCN